MPVSKHSRILAEYTMMAALLSSENQSSRSEEEQSTKKVKEIKKIQRGTKFEYPGFTCFALNKKNADRKYNNWLKSKK